MLADDGTPTGDSRRELRIPSRLAVHTVMPVTLGTRAAQ
jgi:hypothetical protein